MTDHEVLAAIAALALLVWAMFALGGWVLPLRDGHPRFTFRFLAWGALIVAWLAFGVNASNDFVKCLDYALALWAGCRTAHWWHASEKARATR
jgi:hypothetical protein